VSLFWFKKCALNLVAVFLFKRFVPLLYSLRLSYAPSSLGKPGSCDAMRRTSPLWKIFVASLLLYYFILGPEIIHHRLVQVPQELMFGYTHFHRWALFHVKNHLPLPLKLSGVQISVILYSMSNTIYQNTFPDLDSISESIVNTHSELRTVVALFCI
jgi:hypothetical protein